MSREYRTNQVEHLYEQVLGRPADSIALDSGVRFIAHGGTELGLENILVTSNEFIANRGHESTAGFLAALYDVTLRRPIDARSAEAWASMLQLVPRFVVTTLILNSPERAALDTEDLYAQLLQRRTDPGSLSYEQQQLENGVTRDQLASAIIGSDEYFSHL